MYIFIRRASFKLLPASEAVTQHAVTSPHPHLTRVFQPSALLCSCHITKIGNNIPRLRSAARVPEELIYGLGAGRQWRF